MCIRELQLGTGSTDQQETDSDLHHGVLFEPVSQLIKYEHYCARLL